MTPIFNNKAEMEDLPDSVQSVISSVLREDDLEPKLLSNPVVIENLLYRLEPGMYHTLPLRFCSKDRVNDSIIE